MALERKRDYLFSRIAFYTGVALTSLFLSCKEDTILSKAEEYCSIPANHQKEEICGNNFDDNCNGERDENCSTIPNLYCVSGDKINLDNVSCQEKTRGLDISNTSLCRAGVYTCDGGESGL